ncbi:hypothetical protein RJ641_014007 [Dillenia turbinata]|uniref:Beta-galactosidase galactose-binding domain-containing protein n=1 Tax=Dillenia turbinata TaxID=194707 RepID=A0AAN8W562_9MAGN
MVYKSMLVGLDGEKVPLFTEVESYKADWKKAKPGKALTWYKTCFDAPEGTSPVALNLSSMGKGMAWVNGRSLGQYRVSYLSPLGEPTQTVNHIPKSLLEGKEPLGSNQFFSVMVLVLYIRRNSKEMQDTRLGTYLGEEYFLEPCCKLQDVLEKYPKMVDANTLLGKNNNKTNLRKMTSHINIETIGRIMVFKASFLVAAHLEKGGRLL